MKYASTRLEEALGRVDEADSATSRTKTRLSYMCSPWEQQTL